MQNEVSINIGNVYTAKYPCYALNAQEAVPRTRFVRDINRFRVCVMVVVITLKGAVKARSEASSFSCRPRRECRCLGLSRRDCGTDLNRSTDRYFKISGAPGASLVRASASIAVLTRRY